MRYMLTAAFAALMIAPSFAATTDSANVKLTIDSYSEVRIEPGTDALLLTGGALSTTKLLEADNSEGLFVRTNANATVVFDASTALTKDDLQFTFRGAAADTGKTKVGSWNAKVWDGGTTDPNAIGHFVPGTNGLHDVTLYVDIDAGAWEDAHAGLYTGTLAVSISPSS